MANFCTAYIAYYPSLSTDFILLNPFLKVIRAVSRRYDSKCKKLSDSNIQKTSDLFGKKHGDLTQYVTHVTDDIRTPNRTVKNNSLIYI